MMICKAAHAFVRSSAPLSLARSPRVRRRHGKNAVIAVIPSHEEKREHDIFNDQCRRCYFNLSVCFLRNLPPSKVKSSFRDPSFPADTKARVQESHLKILNLVTFTQPRECQVGSKNRHTRLEECFIHRKNRRRDICFLEVIRYSRAIWPHAPTASA